LPKKIISFAHCRIYFLAKTKLQFKGAESMAQLPLFFYRTTVIPNKKRENVSGENAIVKLKNKIVKAKKPNVINYKPLKIKLWHHAQNLQTQQPWNCTG
jgi:hypothetical protein